MHRADAQLVLVDTPGLHKPRTLLGERLNALVRETWAEVDVIGFCLPADEPIGPGDRFIASELADARGARPRSRSSPRPTSSTTRPSASGCSRWRGSARAVGIEWAEVVPVSAVSGDQVQLLEDLLVGLLPDGPAALPRRRAHRRARAGHGAPS